MPLESPSLLADLDLGEAQTNTTSQDKSSDSLSQPPRAGVSASHGPESSARLMHASNILTPPSDPKVTDFPSSPGLSPLLKPLRRAVTEPPSRTQPICPLRKLLAELVGAPKEFFERIRSGCPICSGELDDLGPYALSRSMGSGTFSHVQLGHKKTSSPANESVQKDENVVIKILCRYHPESVTYFENEKRTLSVSFHLAIETSFLTVPCSKFLHN